MSQKRPNRDSVTSIGKDGSRYFLNPADVRGHFTRFRRVFAYFLIIIYASVPFIQINGHPAVLFDAANLRFYFFGLTFASQDFWLGFFVITGLGFFLFYITALLGRLWCGWACPQTVFLEHVYRRIERLIEGDANKRIKLQKSPWTPRKVALRVIKHCIYLVFSLVIAHLFLAYFIPTNILYQWVLSSPASHPKAFVFILIVAGLLYFNFSWFREQLCIIICPYGRLQSALIDDDSLIIGYDEKRGEPRGKVSNLEAGDCIDCNRCVQVCPTGIDIRQGLQMECIGCANCVDACNEIMSKVNRPKGLIRYDSLHGLNGQKTKFIRPRTIVYTILLLLGACVLAFSVKDLTPTNLAVTRMLGEPYYVTNVYIRNQYLLRITNKENQSQTLVLSSNISKFPEMEWIGFEEPLIVGPRSEVLKPLVVQQTRESYIGPVNIEIIIQNENGDLRLSKDVEFLGPDMKFIKNP